MKNYITLQEENEDYEVTRKNKIHQKNDKTYRSLLKSKKDVIHIINDVLQLEEKAKIKPEEIEAYNSSFVTRQLKNKEADIVYKMKEKDIFFLIEHQSKIDYSMPHRIEEYRAEIIRDAIDEKRIKTKEYVIPEVIPILIYTGKDRWDASIYLHRIQDERFRKVNLMQYNLIDINEYTKEELMASEYLIHKMFLIDKTKNGEEFENILKEIIEKTKDETDKERLEQIILTSIREQIGDEKVDELVKKIKKGGERNMLEEKFEMWIQEKMQKGMEKGIEEGMQEGMQKGIQKGIQQGIQQGMKKIIDVMIQKGMKAEEIKDLTGLSKKEIEKIMKCDTIVKA